MYTITLLSTFLYLLLLLNINSISCANILGIVPTPSYSHQIPWQPLWKELHAHGHHLTVLTTDPMNSPQFENLTEIDLHFGYKIVEDSKLIELSINDKIPVRQKGVELLKIMNNLTEAYLSYSPVQELIHGEKKFDLVFIESAHIQMLGFAWKFQAPWISICSMDGNLFDHHVMGNPVHPVLYPEQNFETRGEIMSFWERVQSSIFTMVYLLGSNLYYFPHEANRIRKFFGGELIPLKEIHKNMSAMFITRNSIIFPDRPVTRNTVDLGLGMHIVERKPLPKDLKSFLDEANKGVIYFSLGSNIKARMITNEIRQAFLEAFAQLPYKVLWKFDEKLENLPENVRIETWLPQQEILRHKNVKLFITQAGLQSLQEALINHIPMVCVPFFGDQMQNAQRVALKGIAVKISKSDITAENVKNAILEVINDPKYKETVTYLGEIMLDEPSTGLEKAVWWSEYVLRHKGAKHLRSLASLKIPFYQYYMLDVIAFFSTVVLIILVILLLAIFISFKVFFWTLNKLMIRKLKVE